MNLLLLLSALLSALTGVDGSVQTRDRARAVAEGSVVAGRVAAAPRSVTFRPLQPLAALARSAQAGLDSAVPLMPHEPRYATRRRE